MTYQPSFCTPVTFSSSFQSQWPPFTHSARVTLTVPCRPVRLMPLSMILHNETMSKPDVTSKPQRYIPTKHAIATGRDPERVKVFDTSLRDGELSLGVAFTTEEKTVIAHQLARLGVDVIEAGFPIASDGDFTAVKDIAEKVGNYTKDPPIICGLARALEKDIKRCYEAIKYAAFPRIHTFIATSDAHITHKLRKTRDEVLRITTEMVTYARSLCDDVEFSAEDAARSDRGFLCEVFERAISAGATTVSVPDSMGCSAPAEFGNLIRYLKSNIKGIDNVSISVHAHDDLGIAVPNTLSAVENGARQVEVTVNGIGARAGNASLEEVVMALHVRRRYYNLCLDRSEDSDAPLTNIFHNEIYKSSRLVSHLTGMVVQPNKAIVGANAFAHESGIHQDGVLKHRQTYKIMDAQSIGLTDNSIVLGKHSGRHAFRARIKDMGYELTESELERVFLRFKELAAEKKEILQADIHSVVAGEVRLVKEVVHLRRIQVQCGDHCIPTATVTLNLIESDEEKTATSTGTGPVDAAFNAINQVITGIVCVSLVEYKVNSVTQGIDALGDVTVRVHDGKAGKHFVGASTDTDVVVASAQAYVNAVNRCGLNRHEGDITPQNGKM